jgi:glutathione S-transferase
MVSIQVPDNYGYVILSCVVGQFVASTYMGVQVMLARKTLDVPYPNLYATPGFHKHADEFNRLQRGHLNFFETVGSFSLLALTGGLKYPTACSILAVLYNVGAVLFQKGYADVSLDVEMARYKKGGGLKWMAYFGCLGCAISASGSMNGWW